MRQFRMEMSLLRESFTAITARLESVQRRLEVLEARKPEAGADRVAELESVNGENVFHSVAQLAGRLRVVLENRDVVFAERVGAPPLPGEAGEAGGRARRVVVRLTRRCLRDELLNAARVRRAGLTSSAGVRVYLNERLTRSNRVLFHRVREECRRLQWRYAWTRRRHIFTRQSDGNPVFRFGTVEDLARVFGTQLPASN
ncbi:hypothetical protein ACJJTC_002431 [Scirpophaga incertulas]